MPKRMYHSLKWFERRMTDAGFRVKRQPPMHNTYILGPLMIKGTPQTRTQSAVDDVKHLFFPGKGKAFALVLDATAQPNERRTQMMMDLASFTQLVEWAISSDPGMFMREYRYRKDTDE